MTVRYLFDCRDELEAGRAGKHLVLLLDFDGTLAPIAPTPDEAALPGETRQALEALSRSPVCTVAIVSGRSLEDVRAKVGIEGITYVGNHGLEIVRPGEELQPLNMARHAAVLQRMKEELTLSLAAFPGVIIEDKGCSLAVHYRKVSEENRPLVKAAVHERARVHGGEREIEVAAGAMVLELRPPFGRDKGTIVSEMLESEARRRGEANLFAVYLGDDMTDEDAFKALRGRGWPVLVGAPRISYAEYYLNDPGEVRDLLAMFASGGPGEW